MNSEKMRTRSAESRLLSFLFAPIGVIVYLVVLFGRPISDAEYAEALKSEVESRDEGSQIPLRWRVTRLVAIFLYLAGSVVFFTNVTFWIVRLTYHTRSLSSPSLLLIAGLCGTALLTLAALLWARSTAQRIYTRREGQEKSYHGELIAVVVAVGIGLVAVRFSLPEAFAGFAALVGVAGSIYVVFACKPFRWRNFLLAGTVPALFLAMVSFPAVRTSVISSEIRDRTHVFDAIVAEMGTFITQDDSAQEILMEGVRTPRAAGDIPDLDGCILVLDAHSSVPEFNGQTAVSPVDFHLASRFSAKESSDVRMVVVLGKFGGQASSPFSFMRPQSELPLVAPVLVYQWPEKQLLWAGMLSPECTTEDSPFKVYSAAARALVDTLQK